MQKKLILFFVPGLILLAAMYYQHMPKQKIITIGVVQYTKNNITTLAGFKEGMASGGYREGVNVRYIIAGPATSKQELEPLLKRVLAQKPDLLFVSPTPAARAAKKLTSGQDIPVIFAPVNDPVSAHVVANLEQPEGNLTGVRLSESEGMRLASLKRVLPSLNTVFVPYSPGDKSAEASLSALRKASSKLGVTLVTKPFSRDINLQNEIDYIPQDIDAVFLPREGLVMSRIKNFAALCLERKLPLSTPRYRQVELGALTGYGFVGFEIGRQASRQARKILSGATVAETPVEASTDYLFINLETARKIGIAIGENILEDADYLIHKIEQ